MILWKWLSFHIYNWFFVWEVRWGCTRWSKNSWFLLRSWSSRRFWAIFLWCFACGRDRAAYCRIALLIDLEFLRRWEAVHLRFGNFCLLNDKISPLFSSIVEGASRFAGIIQFENTERWTMVIVLPHFLSITIYNITIVLLIKTRILFKLSNRQNPKLIWRWFHIVFMSLWFYLIWSIPWDEVAGTSKQRWYKLIGKIWLNKAKYCYSFIEFSVFFVLTH